MAEAKKDRKTKVAKKVDKEVKEPIKEKEVKTELVVVAKAGKRSPKALKEAKEQEVKQERKAEVASKPATQSQKPAKKPARTRLERAGKKYRLVAGKIEDGKTYSLAEALALASQTSPSKFDASIELHINLNADPKQAEQNIRGMVVLPAGIGKKLKIAVLADEDVAAQAKKAGADVVAKDEILADLEKEQMNFDVLITTPQFMSQLGKYARLLGPRGLMPNPKSGTVTNDVGKAVTEAKAGRVEYRMDSAGIIHLAVGKASFDGDKLAQNAQAVLDSVRSSKPASIKGTFVKSVYVSSTMGPSIKAENLNF